MKDLITGEQILFTELQNFAVFKSYCILKFGNLVGFLLKKGAEIEFLDVLCIFELLSHLKFNLAEIWSIASRQKIWSIFFEKYRQLLMDQALQLDTWKKLIFSSLSILVTQYITWMILLYYIAQQVTMSHSKVLSNGLSQCELFSAFYRVLCRIFNFEVVILFR